MDRELVAEFYLLDETHDMEKTKTEIFRGSTVIPVVHLQKQSVMEVIITIR